MSSEFGRLSVCLNVPELENLDKRSAKKTKQKGALSRSATTIASALAFPILFNTRQNMKKRRIVEKSGSLNIALSNVNSQNRRYLQDLFVTLVELKWRWTIMIFALGFILSWLFFAIVYYLVSYSHGDFEEENMQNETFVPCVMNHQTFTASFLLSLETQHTIGYGFRFVTEACPAAAINLVAQSIFGVLIQSFVVGMVFAKATLPKKRAQTLKFSKAAVVNIGDGLLCLQFRVGDLRRTQLIDSHVNAFVIKKRTTAEGDILPLYRYDLPVSLDATADQLYMFWPSVITHTIDENSPFYDMSADDFVTQKFEIVVILGGVILSTGQTTEARSSYLNGEILWGQSFAPLVSFDEIEGLYKVNYSRFNMSVMTETPRCSAKELAQQRGKNGPKIPEPHSNTPMIFKDDLLGVTPGNYSEDELGEPESQDTGAEVYVSESL